MTSFSESQVALRPESCSVTCAISARSVSSRSLLAASSSRISACSSICICVSLRVDCVDLGGHRVDLDAQAARGLIDEVDRLVGQEAVGDVAVRELGCRDDRAVGDAHTVVDLVLLLEAAQDGDGVLNARLAHHDGLEAPLERGVLLDVLAVLVECRGADGVELSPGKRGLEHVAGVHRALGRPGTHDRMHLIDEEDHAPLGLLDLAQHRLEPVLELAAVLRARDHRRAGRA